MTTPSEPTAEEREAQLSQLRKRMAKAARRKDMDRYAELKSEHDRLKDDHVMASHQEMKAAMRARGAARVAAGLLKVPEPQYGEVLHALLGDPCAEDMKRFAGAEMAKLRARVHPGGTPPPVARTESMKASGSTPPAAPSRTPAQPVQPDDGGRALVAARLRTARARLKDAKRHGDQQYAIKLRAMVAGLEADAAQVDRPPFSAADRPGTLRCGHQLAARCACPRRSSARGQR